MNNPTQSLDYYTSDNIESEIAIGNAGLINWTLDSGSSYHMTNDLKSLENVVEHEEVISFADGGKVIATHKGDYLGYINDNKITLRDVLYVPAFKRSLISIDCLSDKHYTTTFYKDNNKNCVSLYNKNKNKICTVTSNYNKVYKIWTSKKKFTFNNSDTICDSLSKVNDDMELWHKRLGHCNIDRLKDKLNKLIINYKCKVCACSKMKNLPYKPSNSRAKKPFDLIHMDTVSSPDSSLYGNKYFLTILDDHTRYSWVYFLKSKDQVYYTFLNWYKRIHNIFNTNIKFIRTDNGTEFVNKNFSSFCNENGIIHQLTVPYNPQQNGRAERLNEKLIYTAASLLTESKLNRKFWEDAIHTANYIHNRLPHKGINDQVPFELLYNEKVDYNHLKVFGCQVFFYVPKHFRKKFTDSTLPGIFLGYDDINHTAYRIFDISNNKVVLSRAVSFFEDVPGNSPAPFSTPEFLNILDINKLGGNDNDDMIENDQSSLEEEVIFDNNLNNPFTQNIPNQKFYPHNNLNLYYPNYSVQYNHNQSPQNQNNLNYYNENLNNNFNSLNRPFQQNPQFTNSENSENSKINQFYSGNKNNNYLNSSTNLNNNLNNNSNNNLNNSNNQPIELNENNLNNLNLNNQKFNSENQNSNYNVNKESNHDQHENNQFNANNKEEITRNENKNNINNVKIDANSENDGRNLNDESTNKNLNLIENEHSNNLRENHMEKVNENVNKGNYKKVSLDHNNSVNSEDNKTSEVKLNERNINSKNINETNMNNLNGNLEQNVNKNKINSEESNLNTENEQNNTTERNNTNNENNDELEKVGIDKRKTRTYNRKKNTRNNNKQQTRVNNKKVNKRKRKDKEIIEENNNKTKRIKSFNIEDIIDIVSNLTVNIPTEPFNYDDILNKYDKDEWLKAVEEELNNMKELNVYTVVDHVPKNANIITPKWVFKYKLDANGNIVKRKARLVARGFTQIYGIDFTVTFSPTLRQDSLRLVTAIAAQNRYNIYQIDVKAAYLNAELEENIYIKAPQGDENYGKRYWKLNKALYGLKQAGRMWNNTLNKVLTEMGLTRCKSEPCLYIKRNKNDKIISLLAVYVDDIIITGVENEILKIKNELKSKFKITDVGNVDFIIGIKFEKLKDGYLLHQKRYLDEILSKFNIDKYRPSSNMLPIINEELRKKSFDQTKYKKAIGSLLYLAISTRPDILFAVSKASRRSRDPNYEDWLNVIKIFRYLKGNPNYGIKFTNDENFKVYVDADFGGDTATRKSTTGFVVTMGNGPTSWYSKLQQCVAVSTAESEYYALNECARQCMWYKNLFDELSKEKRCITINTDNKVAIYNCENETINPKSKHIDIKYHQIRDWIKEKKIKVNYVKSEFNLADGFTKYLSGPLMSKLRNNLLTQF